MAEEEFVRGGRGSGYYKRFNALCTDIAKQDWTPDKGYQLSGNQIKYVSASKLKRTLFPCFIKNGFVFNVEFDEPKLIDNTLYMGGNFILTDVETGLSEASRVYGGVKAGVEKAVSIAESYAYRQWATMKFHIVDGLDTEEIAGEKTAVFVKKDAEEILEVKSKIQEKAVKTEPKADKEKTVVPKKEVPKETKQEPKDNGEKYKPTGIETKTINLILNNWKSMVERGSVTDDEYNLMAETYNAIQSKQDVISFIRKFRVVV